MLQNSLRKPAATARVTMGEELSGLSSGRVEEGKDISVSLESARAYDGLLYSIIRKVSTTYWTPMNTDATDIKGLSTRIVPKKNNSKQFHFLLIIYETRLLMVDC